MGYMIFFVYSGPTNDRSKKKCRTQFRDIGQKASWRIAYFNFWPMSILTPTKFKFFKIPLESGRQDLSNEKQQYNLRILPLFQG